MYVKRAERDGIGCVTRSCGRRALKLYSVHIGLTAAAIAIYAAVSAFTGTAELLAPHGRAFVFQAPWRALGSILVMSHQLGYFNILPLYVAMMALAPVVVALTVASPLWALVVSLLLYGATRATGFNLPTAPDAGGWFFNPFAWQLMFTLGVVAARIDVSTAKQVRPLWLAASLAIALVGAAVVTDGFGHAMGLRAFLEAYGDFGKQDLGLARLLNFLALAYLALMATRSSLIVGSRFGQALQRLGRNSLAVFAAGSLLSAGGQSLLTVVAKGAFSGLATPLGLVYTLVSIAVLFVLAYRLECAQQAPPSPGEPFGRFLLRALWPPHPSYAR